MSDWRWPLPVYLACFLCLVIGLAFGLGLCELRHHDERQHGRGVSDVTLFDGREFYDCYHID